MSSNCENDPSMDNDLSKFNLTLYERSIELWRIEEKCRLKKKSIEEIEHSTAQVTLENEWIEKQLHDTKSRIDEVRENIVSMDNINFSLNETLAHLEIQYKKKEFIIHKSKSEHELQLFIRMELLQKEEERLNSIPEVKLLKLADSELNNTKLEYEQLLKKHENLVEKIDIATKENDEKRNIIIVQFAKVYNEMMSLNKREENCNALLRKLKAEYDEKLNIKNALLESQTKKTNKVLFWSHTPSTFDSNILDFKFDLLSQDLKPNLTYSSNHNHEDFTYEKKVVTEHSKLNNNKQRKKVTFLLSSEHKIPLETNTENIDAFNSLNSVLLESSDNINKSSSQLKNNLNVKESTNQSSKKDLMESKEMNFETIEKRMNDGDLDYYSNKRKTIDVQPDYEHIKTYKPVQDTNKIIQPSQLKIIKNIHMDNNFNQEKAEALRLSTNSYNHFNKDSALIDKDFLQKTSSLSSTEQSNLKNHKSNNINMLNDLLQLNENSSDEQGKELSGLFWNYGTETMSQNSENTDNYSYDEANFFEFFDKSCDAGNLVNLNPLSNSNVATESNFRGLQSPQQSESFDESYKEMDTNRNEYLKATTSRDSNDFTQPIKSHFLPSDLFKFNFE